MCSYYILKKKKSSKVALHSRENREREKKKGKIT